VALAGIVVNNNIVLIDTYQEYSRYMPRIEAITRTAEARIRPVLLTTITTMAGLAPMMFGLSLDFFGGGYTVDSPTALWWKQLATAVVFGLGHRDGADARLHALDAGAAGLGHDLCAVDRAE
jgi:multidrug efflux pump